ENSFTVRPAAGVTPPFAGSPPQSADPLLTGPFSRRMVLAGRVSWRSEEKGNDERADRGKGRPGAEAFPSREPLVRADPRRAGPLAEAEPAGRGADAQPRTHLAGGGHRRGRRQDLRFVGNTRGRIGDGPRDDGALVPGGQFPDLRPHLSECLAPSHRRGRDLDHVARVPGRARRQPPPGGRRWTITSRVIPTGSRRTTSLRASS